MAHRYRRFPPRTSGRLQQSGSDVDTHLPARPANRSASSKGGEARRARRLGTVPGAQRVSREDRPTPARPRRQSPRTKASRSRLHSRESVMRGIASPYRAPGARPLEPDRRERPEGPRDRRDHQDDRACEPSDTADTLSATLAFSGVRVGRAERGSSECPTGASRGAREFPDSAGELIDLCAHRVLRLGGGLMFGCRQD